ncbi:hypothetical protein FPQ18DRAFT_351605 [Pyronema domesticum]|nr:hypothetical protein FPQ18DRAFT_351605 [Pyronema domesticum]
MQFSIFVTSAIFAITAFSAGSYNHFAHLPLRFFILTITAVSVFSIPEGMEILPVESLDTTNDFGKRTSWSDCYITGCNEGCKQDFEIRMAAYCSAFNHGIKAMCCHK